MEASVLRHRAELIMGRRQDFSLAAPPGLMVSTIAPAHRASSGALSRRKGTCTLLPPRTVRTQGNGRVLAKSEHFLPQTSRGERGRLQEEGSGPGSTALAPMEPHSVHKTIPYTCPLPNSPQNLSALLRLGHHPFS